MGNASLISEPLTHLFAYFSRLESQASLVSSCTVQKPVGFEPTNIVGSMSVPARSIILVTENSIIGSQEKTPGERAELKIFVS
jgi:hypothetical protein